MSCVVFTIVMTITNLILAFFFVALCRCLRSSKDSASCTPCSTGSVIRPEFVKSPQPSCQDITNPVQICETAEASIRQTEASIRMQTPLPHADLPPIQQTKPAFGSTVQRPRFSQIAHAAIAITIPILLYIIWQSLDA